jgi:two-component sensor histidine kinase
VKYAHPSGLPVELSIVATTAPDGGAVLEIGDDGVGLPEGFEESRAAGKGLKLMRLLVENIGGGLNIKSHALGLTVAIRLPPMLGLGESN